jgi:hypothetical protein
VIEAIASELPLVEMCLGNKGIVGEGYLKVVRLDCEWGWGIKLKRVTGETSSEGMEGWL